MSLSNNFPTVSPTLNLNFAAAGRLDSRVTFTRSSTATYVNQIGLIQSAAVNEPRFDYNPSTLAARGLLIEEQRTNLVTYSEQFDNASWSKTAASITANALAAPDGSVTADKLVEDNTNAAHYVGSNAPSVTDGVAYTISVYAKAGERSVLQIVPSAAGFPVAFANFDLSNGVVGTFSGITSYAITSAGNGWYRCSVTLSANATTTSGFVLVVQNSTTAARAGSYTGNGTSGIYLWGAQLEAGSFATSYIKTEAASVTRSADVASVNTLSPWWNNVEGTLFADYTASSSSFVAMLYTDASNNMVMIGGTSGAAFDVNNAGVVQATLGARVLSAKIAARFKANDFAVCLNGGAVATDTSGTVPSITDRLALGYFPGVGLQINGYLRRVTFYPRTLTSAELQAITA